MFWEFKQIIRDCERDIDHVCMYVMYCNFFARSFEYSSHTLREKFFFSASIGRTCLHICIT
jgi:hypothetical protein